MKITQEERLRLLNDLVASGRF